MKAGKVIPVRNLPNRCEICGNEFISRTNSTVCSKDCRRLRLNLKMKELREINKELGRCVDCGKDKDKSIKRQLCNACTESHKKSSEKWKNKKL